MAEFGLIKSFDIDNGELSGLSSEECFVLGYELAQIDNALENNLPICKPVHANNRYRIEQACIKSKRHFKLVWCSDDTSESWMFLKVKG